MHGERADEGGGAQGTCPECQERFEKLEDLGLHLERHAPVERQCLTKTGRPLSWPCPKGCGRFLAGRELFFHEQRCDGQSPLAPPSKKVNGKEDRMADEFKCADCGQAFGRAQALGVHRKWKHSSGSPSNGGAAPQRRKAGRRGRAPELGRDESTTASIVYQLRARQQKLRADAEAIDEIIERVEGLGSLS